MTGIIIVEDIDLLIMSQNPPQVRVVARGYLPDGCQRIRGVSQERTRNVYRVTISVVRPKADVACTLVAVPFVERVDLDLTGLPLGAYTVIVHGLHGSFEIRAGDDPQ